MLKLGAIVLASIAVFGYPSPGRAAQGNCLIGLRSSLEIGGFTGSLDCSRDRISIRKVGIVRAGGHSFAIFDYHYSLASTCPDCAVHGGQRILITSRGRYIGQYKPDDLVVDVHLGALVLKPRLHVAGRVSQPVRVQFSRNGPQKRILVDGEILDLFR